MTLSIHIAAPRQSAQILEFLRGMHEEVGQAPLHDAKALAAIIELTNEGVAYVVEDEGRIVASLGLTTFDHWYADAGFLGELWFYVDPAYRASGEAVSMLMGEARDLAERTGQSVYIDHHRPRHRRGLAVVADRVGFTPVSRILELSAGDH
jgi:GNAT superfamily N-acetyltransferase